MLISMPTGTSTIFGVFQVIGSSQQVWRDAHAGAEPRDLPDVAQVRNRHVEYALRCDISLLDKAASLPVKALRHERRIVTGFGWPAIFRRCLIEHAKVFGGPRRVCEAIMRSSSISTIGAVLAICLMLPAAAQESSRRSEPAPDSASSPKTLTGKERLGRKWMDEQRIDNCKVPPDKRGSKPRPSVCPHVPMG
jgi:hypothetical protein